MPGFFHGRNPKRPSLVRMTMTDSEFYMWRTLFSFTYVDNNLSLEEQGMLRAFLSKVPFSHAQLDTLKDDLKNPKDVVSLYRKITRQEDKERLCTLARAIVWCEGDMDAQERAILKKLSCLSEPDEEEILHSTRNNPHINDYYQHYARAGMMGLWNVPDPRILRMSA